MTTLDQPHQIDENSVSPQPVIQRYALIGGLAMIVYFLVSQLTGLSNPNGGALNGIINFLLSTAIYLGIAVLAVRHHRDQDLGGFITFGRAFRVGFLTLIFAVLIGVAFNLLYTTVIDPNFYDNLLNAVIEQWEEQGLNEEQIDAALQFTKPMMSPLWGTALGLGFGAIFSAVIALITGAIFKRTHPQV